MKNLKKILFICLIGVFVVTTSCEKENPIKPTPTPNQSIDPVLDLGSTINAKFFGNIVDEQGTPIEGVLIEVGNKTATTDNKGVFIIEDASVFEKMAFLSATKTGFFMGSRSLIASTTDFNNISITLLALDIVDVVNSDEKKTITLTSGAKIDFKGKYIDANGNAYSGEVKVAFKHLPALADATPNQMPGMLYAQNEDEEAGALETYGMIAVELISENGTELQLDPESSATIHLPVDASQLANAPSTIPLWHFDEVVGYWIEEGEATLINGEYVGEVHHFSFWNCDVFVDDAQLNGTVFDQDGKVLANATIAIITPNAATAGQTTSNGTFSTYIPANVSITLQVRDQCGNIIHSVNVGPYATNSVNSETIVATLNTSNAVQVTGIFYDCNSNLVTNGYVSLSVGSEYYYQVITNGLIDLPIIYCNVPTSIDVVAYDISTNQNTTTVSVPVVSPVTDLGTLIACNTITEYVNYTIDNGSQINQYPPFNCENNGMFQITSLANSFQALSFDTIFVGTYNWGVFTNNGIILSDSVNLTFDIFSNQNITFSVNSAGAIGTYIDIVFSGTYDDSNNVNHSITGAIHVLRDL